MQKKEAKMLEKEKEVHEWVIGFLLIIKATIFSGSSQKNYETRKSLAIPPS